VAHWANKILADETVTEQTVLFGGRVAGNVVSFQRDGKRKVGYWIGGSSGARASPPMRPHSSWATRR
jgi:hypothetical protein